jgi:hypothetical protein
MGDRDRLERLIGIAGMLTTLCATCSPMRVAKVVASSPPSLRPRSRKTMPKAVAQERRPVAPQAAQARRLPGRGRGGYPRLHHLPGAAPRQAAFHKPLERLNGEIKRRTDVVGIFPNEDAIVRLVGAILLEQNDESAVQRGRYMTLETIAPLSDDPTVSLPAIAS